jgi:hypothetical protein
VGKGQVALKLRNVGMRVGELLPDCQRPFSRFQRIGRIAGLVE